MLKVIKGIRVKFALEQAMKAERLVMYSSTLSSTSALDGGGLSTPRPGCFNPGKDARYTCYRRLVGPYSRSGGVRKSRPYRDSIPGPSSP
jgi:hypothetical protein